MLEVSRTLVKSEPELAELIAAVEGVEVTMAEKGFGTRVEVRADESSGLALADLERILDGLAEPQKQPFDSARVLSGDKTKSGPERPGRRVST